VNAVRHIAADLYQLLFPTLCAGCGSNLIQPSQLLCLRCEQKLAEYQFPGYPGNRVEKIFYGRLNIEAATCAYYFSKESLVQHLIHQLKYESHLQLGHWLGLQLGIHLRKTGRFESVTAIVPLPLFRRKEKKRGYNQSTILCEGLRSVMPLAMPASSVIRNRISSTQTRKSRWERWQNVANIFTVCDEKELQHQHVLLVDDVITTGATLEACGSVLQEVPGLRLSIATLAFADL